MHSPEVGSPDMSADNRPGIEEAWDLAEAAKPHADKAAATRKKLGQLAAAQEARAAEKVEILEAGPVMTTLDAAFGKPEALLTAAEVYIPRFGAAMDKRREQRRSTLEQQAAGHDAAANQAIEDVQRGQSSERSDTDRP